jgi:hypothetical protein
LAWSLGQLSPDEQAELRAFARAACGGERSTAHGRPLPKSSEHLPGTCSRASDAREPGSGLASPHSAITVVTLAFHPWHVPI